MKTKISLLFLVLALFAGARVAHADDGYFVDLGQLDDPAAALDGSQQYLFAGGVLTFTTSADLGELDTDRTDIVSITREDAGGGLVKYTVELSPMAWIGDVAKISGPGFSFDLLSIDA